MVSSASHPKRTIAVRCTTENGWSWFGDCGGAAIEFAIVGPMLVVMLMGIISYGGYFWLAHSIQQLANDAARAAVAGLTVTERQQLAQTTVGTELANDSYLTAANTTTSVLNNSTALTVSVAFDASNTPFWALSGLVPMPPTTITRSATVMLAGY